MSQLSLEDVPTRGQTTTTSGNIGGLQQAFFGAATQAVSIQAQAPVDILQLAETNGYTDAIYTNPQLTICAQDIASRLHDIQATQTSMLLRLDFLESQFDSGHLEYDQNRVLVYLFGPDSPVAPCLAQVALF